MELVIGLIVLVVLITIAVLGRRHDKSLTQEEQDRGAASLQQTRNRQRQQRRR